MRKTKTKPKPKPVLLGSLEIGARFIKDGKEWEVLRQNWSKPREPHVGKAVCKKVNTPVVVPISRDNYVMRAV